MSSNPRDVILKIFTKKHSLSLTPQSLGFLVNLAQTYNLNATNLSSISDSLALAYLKQDDCSSIVDVDVLQKVYLNLQLNYAGGMNILDNDDYVNEDEIDPRNYLKIVDAFDMPRYNYTVDNKSFTKQPTQSVAGSPASLSQLWLDRYNIIKQIILRNEFFSPPSTINASSHDRDKYMKITSTKNLLGRHNQRFMLFGMLSQTVDGRHALQDPDGVVVLDLDDAVPGEGLFTEGSFVLVDGMYILETDEPVFKAYGIGHPPSEKRSASQSVHGHVDFLGLGGISIKDQKLYKRIEKSLDHIGFIVLSDVWLNELSTQLSLRRLFEGYNNAFNDFRPLLFVLCGNFSSQPITTSREIREYQDSFNKLADIICEFPIISQHSTFVFIPGPNDPWSSGTSTTLPRTRIPKAFTREFESRIPRTHFSSNPTRIRYFSQDIVICRDDAMSRILRNNVKVKEESLADGEENVDIKLKKYLVQTIIDQAHLSPFSINSRPVLWEYDHALRLYPIPTSLILADKYDRYELKYEGCRVFNPGSFSFGMLGSESSNSKPRLWSVYRPWNQEVEYSELPGCSPSYRIVTSSLMSSTKGQMILELPNELLYMLLEYSNKLSQTCRHLNKLSKELSNLTLVGPNAPKMEEFNLEECKIDEETSFARVLGCFVKDISLAWTIKHVRCRNNLEDSSRIEYLSKLPNLNSIVYQIASPVGLNGLYGLQFEKLKKINIKSINSLNYIDIQAILHACPSLQSLSIDMLFYKHYTIDTVHQLEEKEYIHENLEHVVLRNKLSGRCNCQDNHCSFDLVGLYTPQPFINTLDGRLKTKLQRNKSRKDITRVLSDVYNWENDELTVSKELGKSL